jgi:PilZ domain-containing protein
LPGYLATVVRYLPLRKPSGDHFSFAKKMSIERRIQRRFDVCLDAVWDGARSNSTARVADLSEGGCYIDSIAEVTEGEILRLKIKMPSGDWLDLVGVVAHSFPRLGFGLRFVNLDEEKRSQLELVLAHLSESDELRISRNYA